MWEYTTVEEDGGVSAEIMNELGRQGWELVAVYPVIYTVGKEKAVFKRKIDVKTD
jgi:hypothetical protein